MLILAALFFQPAFASSKGYMRLEDTDASHMYATTKLKLGRSALSLVARVRPSKHGYRLLVDNGGSGNGCDEARLWINGSGFLVSSRWSTGVSMCLGSGARNPISLSPLPLNKWSHVAAVWEGNKGMLYLDGNLVATEICPLL